MKELNAYIRKALDWKREAWRAINFRKEKLPELEVRHSRFLRIAKELSEISHERMLLVEESIMGE